MTINRIVVAGLIGGVVAFILGFLFYGLLLSPFFEANAGSATGVARGETEMLWVPMIIGQLAWGMLFAIIYGRWASISTLVTGAKTGAVLAFLVALTYDMISLATTHIMTFSGAIADMILSAIIGAAVGGVVGWFLGKDYVK